MTATLSESDSKELLASWGVPFLPEALVTSGAEAAVAAASFAGPVALKLCGDNVAHKTERGLVRLGVIGDDAVTAATDELLAAARPDDGATGVLVAPMAGGTREFLAGASIDPVFGPTVVVGVGGVLAEALADVSIRLAPLSDLDASEMLDELRTSALLGEFRGEPAVDRAAMVEVLVALSDVITSEPTIRSIDLNPLRIIDGRPVALDALIEVAQVAR